MFYPPFLTLPHCPADLLQTGELTLKSLFPLFHRRQAAMGRGGDAVRRRRSGQGLSGQSEEPKKGPFMNDVRNPYPPVHI